MIRKALQIHAAEIMLANNEGFRPLDGLLHVISQPGVKFVGELSRGASGSAALNLLIKLIQ
jgi:hypothetical protein